jgi:chromosome segregation protein
VPDNFWVEIRDFDSPGVRSALARVRADRLLAGTDWVTRVGPPFLPYGCIFGVQRAEDNLTYLRSQIESDFGLVALETEEGFASQEPLPFDQIVTALPRVDTLPQGAKTEIRRLKGLLNRLGPINPEAQVEYAATKERHEFLSQQSLDLEDASAQMRKVIAELDQLMDQEFRRTFKEVAKAFTRYFTRLFGGGTAKLALTDANDITNTGVEIIARPPGKRPNNLSMLSGGERALTAAALIFAILSVSPTPFCVLDEVDAALDEANITRVRDVLKELTDQAQIIVITHNRGTLEAAETIYGISIGSDSVSQALSLKLDNGRLQAVE